MNKDILVVGVIMLITGIMCLTVASCMVETNENTIKDTTTPNCKIILETDKQIVYFYENIYNDIPKFKKIIDDNNYTIQSVDSKQFCEGIITFNKNAKVEINKDEIYKKAMSKLSLEEQNVVKTVIKGN